MDSLHEITVSATPAQVYDAWTTDAGLRSWWTSRTRAAQGGGVHVFAFHGGSVEFHFRIDEQKPGTRVLWTGVEGPGMPAEWVGTRIDVEITPASDGKTRLRFAHRNWKNAEGAFCACNTTWGELMYRLRDACEGHGRGPLFSE